MRDSIALKKSFAFSLNIISYYKLLGNAHEWIISKQLLRSATSIGANLSEAIAAESKKDFLHKLQIALKEAHETKYWLLLLQESKLVDLNCSKHLADVQDLLNILSSSVKTTKQQLAD